MIGLSPLEKRHLPHAYRWRNDYRIWRWCRQFAPISMERHLAWFDTLATRDDVRMYAITPPDADIVGVCGLTSIDHVNRRAEFSLYIGPEHQGKGYATRALTTLISHGFRDLNLNLIWGESYDGNPAMLLFKDIGMKVDGIRRQFYFRDGEFTDAFLFSITADEWKSQRP